ncbi:PPOX class F420-dependent oxidoreductase [Haladaptatus pallidirubidus]|uniref:PPOX class F420-dependent oxidoreductase n=1 Tax=Haladaptatus pallidirubidus TaxID=1008152 RepID=A0AAV3UGX5_9EURY|nr:PPOX class F420-dependent oxidoreductase [Haladaptatus pallidirubidus]
MSVFTDEEIAYLDEQRLGRLATVGADTQPHVVPVGFQYDADDDTIHIGGFNFGESKKFHDAETNQKVAFVIDDLASIDPWEPRGIEIRGRAETFRENGTHLGSGYDESWIQIHPARIISWGISEDGSPSSRPV